MLDRENLAAVPVRRLRTFDEVAASGRVTLAGAQIGAHVVLLDLTFGASARTSARDLGRQVYVASFSAASSTNVLEDAGLVERMRVQIDGEGAVEHGEPLPVERELASFVSRE